MKSMFKPEIKNSVLIRHVPFVKINHRTIEAANFVDDAG